MYNPCMRCYFFLQQYWQIKMKYIPVHLYDNWLLYFRTIKKSRCESHRFHRHDDQLLRGECTYAKGANFRLVLLSNFFHSYILTPIRCYILMTLWVRLWGLLKILLRFLKAPNGMLFWLLFELLLIVPYKMPDRSQKTCLQTLLNDI